MIGIIGGIISAIGSGIGGFFGLKQKQGEIVQSALSTLGSVQASDADYNAASARAIEAVYQNGSPVERLWRPCLMWLIMGILVARWFFGYVPPGIHASEITALYNWMEIGLIGYMPLRSLEKMTSMLNIGSILKTFVNKKLS